MEQILFLFSLYGFGVFFGMLFKRQLPFIFIGISGFLWGTLIWVVGGTLIQILTIPYTSTSMAILFILLGVGIGIVHTRNKNWCISQRELIYLLLIASSFLAAILLASNFNLTAASPDSVKYIATGRELAYEGLSYSVIEDLLLRGLYVSQLQSASVFLGNDYLYAAQPAFAFTFLLIFIYLSQRISSHLLLDKRIVLILSTLTSLVLFSTYFFVFQFFYIHTNLISAVYLFVGVGLFWLAYVEEKNAWMVVGSLGLLGFSLARNEAPLFALIFLILVVCADRFPYKILLRSLIPCLLIIIVWYLSLLRGVGDAARILSKERLLVMIFALVSFGFLTIFSDRKWIKHYVLPHLPKVMIGMLLLVLIFMVYHKPEHMKTSFGAIINNMLITGEWGSTWLVFSFLLLISLAGPRVPWEELFFYGLSSFLSLLLALSYIRIPYRSIWVDSANRMLTHILPIVLLYVLMKAVQGFSGRALTGRKIK